MRRVFIALLLCWLSTSPHIAVAEDRDDPISTDRPDFTESAVTLRAHQLQIEAGGTSQWEKNGGGELGFPEALVRYGITNNAEFRFFLPDFFVTRDHRSHKNGLGDISTGISFRLGPLPDGDEVSIIPALNYPTGKNDYSSNSLDPEIKLCWSRELSENWDLAMMGYGLWTTVEGDRSISYQQTASFGRKITEPLDAFFEYAGTFAENVSAQHIFHTGLAYVLDIDSQVDIHGGFTMNGDDRLPFLGLGYSRRFR